MLANQPAQAVRSVRNLPGVTADQDPRTTDFLPRFKPNAEIRDSADQVERVVIEISGDGRSPLPRPSYRNEQPHALVVIPDEIERQVFVGGPPTLRRKRDAARHGSCGPKPILLNGVGLGRIDTVGHSAST